MYILEGYKSLSPSLEAAQFKPVAHRTQFFGQQRSLPATAVDGLFFRYVSRT